MQLKQERCAKIFMIATILLTGEMENTVLMLIKSIVCLCVMAVTFVIGKLDRIEESE